MLDSGSCLNGGITAVYRPWTGMPFLPQYTITAWVAVNRREYLRLNNRGYHAREFPLWSTGAMTTPGVSVPHIDAESCRLLSGPGYFESAWIRSTARRAAERMVA